MKPAKNTEVLERTLLLRIEELENIATALLQENRGLKNKLTLAETELKNLKGIETNLKGIETNKGTNE